MSASAARAAIAAASRQHMKPVAGLTHASPTKHRNKPASAHRRFSVHPKLFVFFDKKTGSRRFEVNARLNGRIPIDEAAGLLAMHCIARQQLPADFSIMVAASENLTTGLAARTRELMQTCSLPAPTIPLSRRQQEVLGGIAHNLTNKEIAANLYVAERTVKFHVSTLLKKFGVQRRSDLMLEMFDMVSFGRLHKREAKPPRAVPQDEIRISRLPAPVMVPSVLGLIEQRPAR